MTAPIERAIARTRKNAWTQLAWGAALVVSWLLWPGSSMVVLAIFLGLSTLLDAFILRRLWRLRSTGPAVTALLHNPDDIASVASWPRKIPPDRLPVFLDVFTRSGHQCSLMLDSKKRDEYGQLVDAIRTRSPNAIITVANEQLGRSAVA